jgi:hypothetical protein
MTGTNAGQQHSIVFSDMSYRAAGVLALVLWLSLASWAVDGTFQGRVIDPPPEAPHTQGWIYVQGPNHMLRRVEVSHANIVFGENIPVSQRHKCGMECLTAGLVIRVTAEQDRSGEWRAKRGEILKLVTNRT